MGEDRCGAPAAVDSWQPGAFEMKRFAPRDLDQLPTPTSQLPKMALRRFRHPVAIRMRLDDGKPARVAIDRRGMHGGRVDACAGPWRTTGAWWDSHLWNRDEWDVALESGETYRVFHDRDSDNWFLDGVVD